ncbi:MAG: hypothetical protein LWX83_08100, partial [Anaerolineae bacterium]|nr:hypothetical protein [Anaerolineae bacterium]
MVKIILGLCVPSLWFLLIITGGIWICRGVFNLRRNEQTLTGLACGLIIQIWLARWLALFLNPMLSSWVSAILVFLAGLIWVLFRDGVKFWRKFPLQPLEWILLFFLTYLLTNI